VPQSPLQQIRILKAEPWTIPVDSHPIGRLPLSYPVLQKFHSPDVVASGHLSRHSRHLRIPATPSSGAHRETTCFRKQHQHHPGSPDRVATAAHAVSSQPLPSGRTQHTSPACTVSSNVSVPRSNGTINSS